jgi:transposase IS116/IS110/IS902 family protein
VAFRANENDDTVLPSLTTETQSASSSSSWMRGAYPASVRRWRPLWLPASRIRKCSGQGGTSRPGLVLSPKQNSSGGKDRLGNISKRGDRYLRSLFTTGALAVIRYAKIHGTKHRPWLTALLTRRPTKVAATALVNKIARMAWAMMARGQRYKEPAALAA